MSTAGQLGDQGQGAQPPAVTRPLGRRVFWRGWRWLVLASLALVAAAGIVLAVLAGTYQPLVPGGAGSAVSGAAGIRNVNTFAASTAEIYIPSQKGPFTVWVNIRNSGPEAVTIETVRVGNPWPLVRAGSPRYQLTHSFASRPFKSYRLGSGAVIGIPVRTDSHCYASNSWVHIDSVSVEERFLIFTRWVSISLANPLVLHAPGGTPRTPGAVCAR
ncbi:MAG: hypothetical protein LBI49_00140 [Nocardiopsaceae bacterium]|jgi:hypothetical protein|nr:hypothetical protein [Nocardiopsaceae bacterium]